MLLPRLSDVSFAQVPPLQDMKQAVERDMRALWAGVDVLRLQQLPAANEPTFVPKLERVMQRGWQPPLGWISLAAAGALLAGLGFAQMQMQRHFAPTVKADAQRVRGSTRQQKKIRRTRPPEKTDYSRGT